MIGSKRYFLGTTLLLLSVLISCSGGGGGDDGDEVLRTGNGSDSANFDCDGDCPNLNLTTEDVSRIIQQGVAGAQALGVSATIVVIDRPANVLALYQMPGARTTTQITSGTGAVGGIEGAVVPAAFAAISKAGASSYFSSQGNAFTTRTANQVLQENFLPGELFTPSGPLFGVQFSQGLCSDINLINPDFIGVGGEKSTARGLVGPRPLPLGFAAEPGTVPLYKRGDMVGAVGVEFDGIFSLDRKIADFDDNPEERIALTASIGFEAPSDRVASVIFVRGKSLRYTDLNYEDLEPLPAALPALDPSGFITVPAFTNGEIRAGSVYGDPSSGFARTTRAGLEVEVIVGENGEPRFPTRGGAPLPGGEELTAREVDALLDAAILTAARTRSQVRRPLGSAARVAIWITDQNGTVIGFVRSKDTILDSTDVTLQKGRPAVFFSAADAGALLRRAGLGGYVSAAEALLGEGVFDGRYAWSGTALGNISRPYFPDGINGNPNGPLSLPVPGTPGAVRTFSIFNTGLQLDLYQAALLAPLSGSIPDSCTDRSIFGNRLRNGVQFFAGAFPLYRGTTLIGGFSSSGDGTEQDDLVPFYGASRAGLDYAGHTDIGDPRWGFNAPAEIRADQINVNEPDTNLRYVVCPEAPFIDDNSQNVCDGL